MRRIKLCILFSAALLLAACATTTNTNTSIGNSNRTVVNNVNTVESPAASPGVVDEFAAARATYKATCVNCHKENGEGGVAELDDGVKIKVPSFKTAHSIEHTDQQFARKIANGDKKEGMPAFKDRLSPEQINSLVRFIRREFQSSGPKEGMGHSDD